MPKISLIVMQSTTFCNIDCKYCYLTSRQLKNSQPLAVVRQLVERLLEYNNINDPLVICWHAGEPLIRNASFYQQAFEAFNGISERSGIRVTHSIQTNGTLIDENWIDLFRTHDVHVGISIDGPKEAHDSNRITRSGTGTHAKVVQGLRLLVDAGISFGAIAVVGDFAMSNPERFHDFFVQERVPSVGLNVPEIEGINTTSYITGTDAYPRFVEFIRALSILSENRPSVVYREINDVIDFARSGGISRRSSTATLGHILNVAHDGRFSSYSPELLGMTGPDGKDFILGTLATTSLQTAFKGKRAQELDSAIARGVKECSEQCGLFDLCGGGSPSNKLAELGVLDGTRTAFCSLSQRAVLEGVIAAQCQGAINFCSR